MKQIIFVLNSSGPNLKSLFHNTDWEKIEIESISSIDYDLIKNNQCALLVCGKDQKRVKDLFAGFELTSSNLPTVFLLEKEEKEIIDLCYYYDFTNIFINTEKHLLIKAFLSYTFENYSLSIRSNCQKWLKHIDPNNFTKKEFQIIEYIAQAPLTELSREELQNFIWGKGKKTTNKLDVHICNLRKKLINQNVMIQTNERGKVSLGFASGLH
ncbi:MAG: winged helix-turn-helix domain-containing protein, partial [Bacteriovoracaceae bacterium]